MVEEMFTFDDLYDFLREELSSKDLQPLDLKKIKKIKKYLHDKEKLFEKAKSSKFSKERRRLLEEIENAKQVLTKLYQKRVKKIITRAIFNVRSESGAKDTSNMMLFEEELYLKLIKELKTNEENFFSVLDKLKIEEEIKKETKELKSKEKEKKETEDTEQIKIKLNDNIPKLTGTNLKDYGPYKKGEKAKLPEDLAKLIIKQGKGSEIK